MKERRKSKRYSAAYPLEYAGDDVRKTLYLVDVSKHGIAFLADNGFARDDKIELELFLKTRMFRLAAVIVHSRFHENHYAIGARFTDIPDDFEKCLEREIAEIKAHHNEAVLSRDKEITFRNASAEYLRNMVNP